MGYCKPTMKPFMTIPNTQQNHINVGAILQKFCKYNNQLVINYNGILRLAKHLKYRKMFASSLVLPIFDYLDVIYNKSATTKLLDLDILLHNFGRMAPMLIWFCCVLGIAMNGFIVGLQHPTHFYITIMSDYIILKLWYCKHCYIAI